MYVNTINNVTKRHMPAEREKQKVAVFDSAVILDPYDLLSLCSQWVWEIEPVEDGE